MNTVYRFDKNKTTIFLADALDALQSLEDESVDLIFADPPYNIGKQFANFADRWPSDEAYIDWSKKWLSMAIQKLSPSGTMYVMASTQSMPYIDLYLRQRLTILSRIVWHYDSSGVQAKRKFGSLYEPILHCVKNAKQYTFNADSILVEAKTGAQRKLIDYRKKIPTVYNSQKVPGNVWYFPRVRYRMPEYEEHPSQKPEALLERIILASSNPDDLILDPFSGTFTTCAVAQKLGRRCIGIEKQEKYFKIGLRRLKLATSYKGEKLYSPPLNSRKRHSKSNLAQLRIDL
jgi:site-specific DNA-methyltransferase (adenine-specific)